MAGASAGTVAGDQVAGMLPLPAALAKASVGWLGACPEGPAGHPPKPGPSISLNSEMVRPSWASTPAGSACQLATDGSPAIAASRSASEKKPYVTVNSPFSALPSTL